MSLDQNPKDEPPLKRRLPKPIRRKYIKPGYEPKPKRTHQLWLLANLKTDKK